MYRTLSIPGAVDGRQLVSTYKLVSHRSNMRLMLTDVGVCSSTKLNQKEQTLKALNLTAKSDVGDKTLSHQTDAVELISHCCVLSMPL